MIVTQPPHRALRGRPHPPPLTQKPAITPALCDGFFNYLQSGATLTIQTHGAKMEAYRTPKDGVFHAVFTGNVKSAEPFNTPILLDLIEEIAVRSSYLIRRLQASFALDVHSSAC